MIIFQFYRNALLAHIKILMALMNLFAFLVHLIVFQVVLSSYMYEVTSINIGFNLMYHYLPPFPFLIAVSWPCLTLSCIQFSAGGVTKSSCPYKCISDKYRMPNCYTPLEELVYTFGGPWPFAILLSCILVLLALLLNTLRTKFVGSGSYNSSRSIEHSHHRSPYLLSLSEVCLYVSFLFQQ